MYFTQFLASNFSVITMKSALASTWESVYLLQTIACLSDQFQRTRQEKVYWKTLAKLQVSFKSTEVDLCQKLIKTNPQSLTMLDMTTVLEVRLVIVLSYRGSPGGDIVPPARRQEKEPWLLFPGV